jgi:hypothetical protein
VMPLIGRKPGENGSKESGKGDIIELTCVFNYKRMNLDRCVGRESRASEGDGWWTWWLEAKVGSNSDKRTTHSSQLRFFAGLSC